MTGIQSLGSGSGVLTSDLVDKLIAAERTPIDKRLTADKALVDARVEAFAGISSLLNTFRSTVSSLALPSAFKTFTASSSSDAALTASASSVATPGNYTVNVIKLAQVQTLATKQYASLDSVVGEGTLQFTFGDVDYETLGPSFGFAPDASKAVANVVISNSNHTLSGVRDAINSAGIGVTASIVDTGSGFKLLMQSKETGDSNGFRLTASNPSNGLDDFEFKDTTTQLTQTLEAQDASLTINGLGVTRASNTLVGVINGVTLNLKQETASPVSITVARNTEAISKKVSDFVDAYNALKTQMSEVTAYNSETNSGGVLIGDSTVRGVGRQLQQMIGSVVPGLVGGNYRTLAEVGITTAGKTGLLSFDSAKFSSKLNDGTDNVTAMFGTVMKSNDSQVKTFATGSKTVPGTYAVNVTQLATRSSLVGAVTAGEPFVVDANNDNFTVQINGVQSASLSLTQGAAYTGAQLATEMQTQINNDAAIKTAGAGVEVSYDSGSGAFSITSSKYGSSSKVLIFAVDAATTATLGLSAVGAASGVNVAGTINGVAATSSGQLLTGAVGDASEGFMVEITGGSTGSRGSVSYIRGIAQQMNDLILSMKSVGGSVTVKEKALQDTLASIAKQRTDMEDRLEAMRVRLAKQFSFNDALISRLNTTGNYITQQMNAYTAAQKQS
jgi:flagellar hook-associated protein 2